MAAALWASYLPFDDASLDDASELEPLARFADARPTLPKEGHQRGNQCKEERQETWVGFGGFTHTLRFLRVWKVEGIVLYCVRLYYITLYCIILLYYVVLCYDLVYYFVLISV